MFVKSKIKLRFRKRIDGGLVLEKENRLREHSQVNNFTIVLLKKGNM